jgi:ribokinase
MKLGVTVVGSVNLDVVVGCSRIAQPGETVVGHSLKTYLGGKGANQAVAAARVTDQVKFIGVVGADESGKRLQEQLSLQGLGDARIFVDPSAPTGTAIISVDELGDNAIVVVPGANQCWPNDAADHLTRPTICVAQFETPLKTTLQFFSRNRRLGGRNILNPAPYAEIPPELLALVDRLVLNETEYLQFRSIERGMDSSLARIQSDLRNAEVLIPIIVTVGDQGVLFKLTETKGRLRAFAVKPLDTTGAGDCFVGVYAALLSQKYDEIDAIRLASAAAALSVTRAGAAASMPHLSEILEFARSQPVNVELL